MALSNRARDWWNRRAEAQAEREMASIPVLDIRLSEEVRPPMWPSPDVLSLEDEAELAPGTADIPLNFQTRTSNPPRPRTVAAGYDPETRTLRIKFRPGASAQSPGGAVYDYHDVSPKEWDAVQRTISTGRLLNRSALATKDYTRLY